MEHFVEKLKDIERTFNELEQKLSDPAIIGDQSTFMRLARTRHQLERTVSAYHRWLAAEKRISEAQELLRTESEKEMRELAETELEEAR